MQNAELELKVNKLHEHKIKWVLDTCLGGLFPD